MLKAILILTCIAGTIPAIAAADEAEESSAYVGSDTCGACHADEYNAWKTSKHAAGDNRADGSEKTAEPSQDWIQNCSGCHTTNRSVREPAWSEMGVGCEACHGPGREHVSNMGDTGKIVMSREADICGRCHGGNLSGAEIRCKPLGRRRVGIRDFHPRMVFGIGDVESPISSFGQFKSHRAGNANQRKQAGEPRQTAASVQIEQG